MGPSRSTAHTLLRRPSWPVVVAGSAAWGVQECMPGHGTCSCDHDLSSVRFCCACKGVLSWCMCQVLGANKPTQNHRQIMRQFLCFLCCVLFSWSLQFRTLCREESSKTAKVPLVTKIALAYLFAGRRCTLHVGRCTLHVGRWGFFAALCFSLLASGRLFVARCFIPSGLRPLAYSLHVDCFSVVPAVGVQADNHQEQVALKAGTIREQGAERSDSSKGSSTSCHTHQRMEIRRWWRPRGLDRASFEACTTFAPCFSYVVAPVDILAPCMVVCHFMVKPNRRGPTLDKCNF